MNKRNLAIIIPILLPVIYYIVMIIDFNGPGLLLPSHQLGNYVFLPLLFIIDIWSIWENSSSSAIRHYSSTPDEVDHVFNQGFRGCKMLKRLCELIWQTDFCIAYP